MKHIQVSTQSEEWQGNLVYNFVPLAVLNEFWGVTLRGFGVILREFGVVLGVWGDV